MYNQQRRKYESNSTSRMAQARGTNPGSGRGDPERASRSRIHNRAYPGTRRPAGRQIEGPIQRPGASASRNGSSHEQPQKHAACRSGNNSVEIITLRAPSWGLATSHPFQASSFKRQAASRKLQATSIKLQAFKIIVDQI